MENEERERGARARENGKSGEAGMREKVMRGKKGR